METYIPVAERPQIRIARLAARQHNVVAVRQLVELGLQERAIRRWAATGRLHRVFRGVFAVGSARLTELGRIMAAVLACGPRERLPQASVNALIKTEDGFREGDLVFTQAKVILEIQSKEHHGSWQARIRDNRRGQS